jgi:hypothetical protein
MATAIRKTAPATIAASRQALGVTAADITIGGLSDLSVSAGNGLARFALALYLAETVGKVSRADIMTATGLYKGRVSTLIRAGEILSRCGKGAADVARQATALCEAASSKVTDDTLGGLSGQKLCEAVSKADAAVKAAKKTRGAGKKTAAEKPAKRTAAKVLGDAHDAVKAVETVPNTAIARSLAEGILAQAVRIVGLAGLDLEVVLADLAAAAAGTEAVA